MDTRFETEEQQVEALKRWWSENGRAVLWGLVVGMSILVGSRFWYQHVRQQAVAASQEYEQLRRELSSERFDAVRQRAGYLREHFAETPYAVMAAMIQARLAVDEGALDEAGGHLRWVLEQEPIPEYRDMARFRLARVLFAQGRSDAALERLSGEWPTLQALVEELRGDILVSKGEPEAARSAYTRALAALPDEAPRDVLRMKLSDLGAPVS